MMSNAPETMINFLLEGRGHRIRYRGKEMTWQNLCSEAGRRKSYPDPSAPLAISYPTKPRFVGTPGSRGALPQDEVGNLSRDKVICPISESSPIELLKLMVSCANNGPVPVLGAERRHREAQPKNPFIPGPKDAIGFLTSGSTGEPNVVFKTWINLLSEAQHFKEMLQLDESSEILSLVPPHHLYGFLFSFLVPYLASASVTYILPFSGMPVGNDIDPIPFDAAITVPATWSLVSHWLERGWTIDSIISSAGAFGSLRSREFLDLKRQRNLATQFFEIFGSTETGGIGIHTIQSDSEPIYQLLPEVELIQQGDVLLAQSPYINTADHKFPLADQLQILPERRFLHLGREDRIIKFAGHRLSLATVEDNLRELLSHGKALCFFEEDEVSPKGGELIAFIISEKTDTDQLKAQYLQRFSGPFPSQICYVRGPVYNTLGKVTLAQLRENAVD